MEPGNRDKYPQAPASEPPEAVADGAAGAPPSNTAPANCTDGPASILRVGIDSLYVSYYGELDPRWAIELPEMRAAAQSPDLHPRLQAQVPLGGHLLEVLDRGSGRFSFVLRDNWFRIALASSAARALPLAYVQVSSEALTMAGLEASLEDLGYILNSLGAIQSGPHMSRIDLCADFVPATPLTAWDANAWVSRAKDRLSHTSGRRFSGWSIGLGGDISARLYDKTLEIQKSGKAYFEELWRDAGWDGSSPVWRLEFQLRRPALVELGLDLVRDAEARLADVWRYCARDWLELKVPNPNDDTPTRWPTHPLWLALATAWDSHAPGVIPLTRARKERIPTDQILFRHGLGSLTSFMAARGITNLDEGFGEFLAQAKSFHDTLGDEKDFHHYIVKRVLEKGRKFNRIKTRRKTEQEREAEKETARRYKKAKDGE